MKKRLIVIGGVLVVLVVLVIVLLTNLEAIVNKNKDALLARAKRQIGRDITVEKIGVTLRGGIGVRLENFTVADDPQFSSEPFVEAQSLQVNAKILPLLRKQFEIKRVVLNQPLIRVTRDENGTLSTSTFGSAPTEPGTPGAAESAGSPATAPLVVSLIDINGGELRFVDKKEGLDLRVTQIESSVEELDFTKPISLEISAAFLEEKPNIELDATFGPVGQEFDIENLAFESSLTVDPIDVDALADAVPAAAKAMPPDVAIGGPVSARIDASGTLLDMKLDVRFDVSSASVSMPEMLDKPAGVTTTVALKGRVTPETVAIDSYDLVFHKLEATGKAEYRMTTPPSITLSVDSEPTSLADWRDLVPALKVYDPSGEVSLVATVSGPLKPGGLPDVEGKLSVVDASLALPQLVKPLSSIRSEIAFTGKSAEVKNASVAVGGSAIEGSATIESFEPLVVVYRAASPTIALADIRPPNPKAKKPEVLRDVRVSGRMVVEETPTNRGEFTSSGGSLGDIDYQKLEGHYEIVGKETRFENVKATALDGSIKGAGAITVEGDAPTFDFEAEATNIDLVAFFEKLPDVSRDVLHGRANMTLNISGTGKEWQSIQTTISGGGVARLFDGEIVDVNIFDNVVKQLAEITGNPDLISQGLKEKYPRVFKDRNTSFESLGSDFVIQNGRLLARNLSLEANDFRIAGVGSIGFDKSLDLTVNMVLSDKLSADLIADFTQAKYLANNQGRIEVPFGLEGNLPKVRAKLDQDYINNLVQKALVEQIKKQTVGDGLKKLLDFGNKKQPAPADTTKKQ
jgi:uncharacterized protein involved in outer membrane biogenesis